MLLKLKNRGDGIDRTITVEDGVYTLSSNINIEGIGLTISKHNRATSVFNETTTVLTSEEAQEVINFLVGAIITAARRV